MVGLVFWWGVLYEEKIYACVSRNQRPVLSLVWHSFHQNITKEWKAATTVHYIYTKWIIGSMVLYLKSECSWLNVKGHCMYIAVHV